MKKKDCTVPHCPVCNAHCVGGRSRDGAPAYPEAGHHFEIVYCREHGMLFVPEKGDAVSFQPSDLSILPAKLGAPAAVGLWAAYIAGLTAAEAKIVPRSSLGSILEAFSALKIMPISLEQARQILKKRLGEGT